MADLVYQQSVTVLLFTRAFSPLYRRLCLNLAREVASYLYQIYLLPSCHSQSIRVYDLEKSTCKDMSLGFSVQYCDVNCALDWKTILYLSPRSPSCKIDLISGKKTPIAAMALPRENPGAICVYKTVYVFGGKASDFLTFSEKYLLDQDLWQPLPPLPTPKYAFNPCHYQRDIYLPEVNNSLHSFHIFHIAKDSYQTIPFKVTNNLNGCVSFIVGEELIMLTISEKFTINENCVRWNLQTMEVVRVSAKDLRKPDNAYSSCSPLVYRGLAYWVNYNNGHRLVFDPQSLSLRDLNLA